MIGSIFVAWEEKLKRNGEYRKQWPLDHIPMEALEGEVAYREGLLLKGLCSYCEKPRNSAPCKFDERHKGSECR